ncbi:MAG: SDR family oxidoreductase [Pseudomonadales bacterium]|nr:SDR family oxidoreductase [Pseudomonadales bacterium]
MPPDSFDSQVCVLTGAAGGIGRELARELTGRGAKLVISGRRGNALSDLRTGLPAGSVAAAVAGDLRDEKVRAELAATASAAGATVLVNLSGANAFGMLERQTSDDIAELIETNLVAPMQLTRLLLPHLLAQQVASIVNVGSVLGEIGHPGYTAYCASKFGLRGFSEALRRELADTSVTVQYLGPRTTRTTMNDAAAVQMNEMLGNSVDEPAEVAKWIADAMAEGRLRGNFGWPERFFCRINALLPGVVDGAIAGKLAVVKRFA